MKLYSLKILRLFLAFFCLPTSAMQSIKERDDANARLIISAQDDDLETVRFLLAPRAHVNAIVYLPSSDGKTEATTALAQAAQNNRLAVMQCLLENKADPNLARSQDGYAPIMIASINGHTQAVGLLLNAKANPNMPNPKGHTPLMAAAQFGYIPIVDELLNAKADPNRDNEIGYSPLMAATAFGGRTSIIQKLLEARADIHRQALDLLERGGKVRATALHKLAQDGHLDAIQLLVQAKADVNQARSDGITPLAIAINKSHAKVVNLLIAAGAHKDSRDIHGRLPIDYATNEDMRRLLQDISSSVHENKDPQ